MWRAGNGKSAEIDAVCVKTDRRYIQMIYSHFKSQIKDASKLDCDAAPAHRSISFIFHRKTTNTSCQIKSLAFPSVAEHDGQRVNKIRECIIGCTSTTI